MNTILQQSCQIIESTSLTLQEKLLELCKLLNTSEPKYTWVGFYFMQDEEQLLHLGPYIGEETEHTTIPYGRGICGQVAASGTTYLATDVQSESNYIACSINVRSEIVIPIYDSETLVAQLDIDSNQLNAFSAEDHELLEELCFTIGEELGPEMHYDEFFQAN